MNGRLAPSQQLSGRGHQRIRSRERGQSMVELALIMPLVLVLLFAIVDFGRAYSAWVTITNAAREGARYAITDPTNTNAITNRTLSTAGSYGSDGNLGVSVSCPSGCVSGKSVVVQTTYNLSLITPLVALVKLIPGTNSVPSTFTLTSSADMRIE